jgi:hypothetical protein
MPTTTRRHGCSRHLGAKSKGRHSSSTNPSPLGFEVSRGSIGTLDHEVRAAVRPPPATTRGRRLRRFRTEVLPELTLDAAAGTELRSSL